MKQKLLSFVLLCTLLVGVAYAQNRQVSGKVTSSSDGTPVSGSTVTVVGGSVSTQTDVNGNYSISVPGNGSLRFSNVGFTSQVVPVNNRSTINVTLVSSETNLDEVVVTGYSNIRKSEFVGSAVVLGSSDVENKPVANLTQNLQGRVPGLMANSGSGQPGANANIQIRGTQSIQGSGAQPLIIVDGVPYSGNLSSLNPNDFESLTVLKDASAAALYGARGGVGVIVITTKQGKAGTSEVSVRTQMGVTAPPDFKRLNLMSTAELLGYEERVGLITNSTNAGFSNVPGWYYSRKNPANAGLSEAQLLEFDRKLDSTRNINTDIADMLYRHGVSQTYEISLRGGSENTTYFTTLGYFDQDGIDKSSDFNRFTGRFNLNHTKDRFNMSWNNNLAFVTYGNAIGDSWGNSTLNPGQMIYRAKPYDYPYLADGSLNYGGGSTNLNLKTLANLIETMENSRWTEKTWKINTGLNLSFKITDDLTLRNVTGLDADNNLYEYYINPNSYRGSVQTYKSGFAREANSINATVINTTSLNYRKTFNEVHNLSAGVYFEGIRAWNKGLGFVLYNLNPSLPWTGQGANPLPTEGAATMGQSASSARSGYGIRSYFATANYDYDGRYSLNANIRRDGTSRIVNVSNREITTWSIGGAWDVMKESFLADQNIFNEVRLRASYGANPNIGSISINSYGVNGFSVPNYQSSQIPAFGTGSYSGSTLPGIVPTTPGNPNLKIETVNKANIGVDLAAWSNRARLTVDIYKNVTKNLFVNQPLSNTTGFDNMAINAGQMSNKGIEGALALDVFKNTDWNITVGANHAININNIDDLGLVNEYVLGTFLIKKGLPFGSHYTFHYLGADPQTGKPRYYAPDGETVVNTTTQAGKFATFGTYKPKHMGGFYFDVDYKGFSLSTLFSYQFDAVRSNNVRNWITDGTRGYIGAVNQSRELLDNQWEKPGDEKWYPSPLYAKDFTSSDLENARFLKLRNVMLAYNIPTLRIGGKQVLKGAKIYANGYNLVTWSPWTGVDPEDDNNISLYEYPNSRSFVFGIDFKF